MYTCDISINNIETARAFVNMTSKFPAIVITLNSEEYTIDAHSIIGILSLDLSRPIRLEAQGEDIESFVEALEPFTV